MKVLSVLRQWEYSGIQLSSKSGIVVIKAVTVVKSLFWSLHLPVNHTEITWPLPISLVRAQCRTAPFRLFLTVEISLVGADMADRPGGSCV